jgi:hypothetical protein
MSAVDEIRQHLTAARDRLAANPNDSVDLLPWVGSGSVLNIQTEPLSTAPSFPAPSAGAWRYGCSRTICDA